jgi:UDP-N-acetylmuramoyl-tripeptide--D-alanyl-D-alanine ligase
MQQWPATVTRPGATPIPAADQPAFDATSLAAAVGGRVVRETDRPIRGGAVDSRRVEPANAFFALPGERTDGHEFLAEAAQRGASALVVSSLPTDSDLPAGRTVILVPDTLAALGGAAGAWRTRFDPLVVGVTGSLAKTSTKEQIAEVLAEGWGDSQLLRNNANENNEVGLPLTLLRLERAHEVAVLEMGMYVPGDIAMLAALARPRIGVVTAVRPTHLARAGSIDAIERGKRELVNALPAGGTAVLNADDPRVDRMADALRADVDVIRYGFDSRADVTATNIESLADRGMRFRLLARGEEVEALSPALGRHGVHNALAGAAVGLAAGLDLATIARGLARPYSAPHRSTLIDLGDWRVLDDTYNAGPDSMAAALDLLASLPGRRIAVLGEMLELGELTGEAHRGVGEHAARTADVLIAVGPTASDYAAGARAGGMSSASVHETADREAAVALLLSALRPGDVVLLKASRGAELDLLLAPLHEAAQSGRHA